MKNFIKKTIAALLAVVMVSSTFVGFAAELNQDAVNEHYGQFENYLLLGDSVASGYRDEISENDAQFNESCNETTYWRVPGSYADVLANAIIEDKSMTAFAGPGYRTIEMRYMLEDDYAAACEDEYLFWPSHLYVYEDQLAPDGSGEYLLPGAEYFRKSFQKAVSEADLITLGVGGNDWGAYLGWVIAKIIKEENCADKYVEMAQEVIDNGTLDMDTIEQLVEIAHLAGALPALVQAIPEALSYGLGNFYTNWDIMIQDIYDLNPDVTLVVLGMSDNSLKGKYFDYDGVEGEPVSSSDDEDESTAQLMTTIIDFIMSVGNKPMIDGAEKFGYIFVDTDGTTYVDSHPDADGHVFIANKIIEALPDPEVSTMYDDVKTTHKYYSSIEYVVKNGIMTGTSETTFSPDAALTKAQLEAALENLGISAGVSSAFSKGNDLSALDFAVTMFKAALEVNSGLMGFIKALSFAFGIIGNSAPNVSGTVVRGVAAGYLMELSEM